MDVRHVGDHECINCAKCMGACNQNALSLRCGNHTLIAPACGCSDDREDSAAKRAKNGKIGWGVALAVLCFALLWFNVLDPDLPKSQAADATVQTADAGAQAGEGAQASDGTQTGEAAASGNSYTSNAPIGTAIGNQLADVTAEKLDGTQFHLADTRGKVVILNMWATYCGPCVQELPEFESFQKAHADDVVVFIIHASDPLEDVPEFLAKKGIGLPCAIESDDDRIYTLCGANPSILPHTVVLNRSGEITYNQTGSMTGALLDELFEKAK
jgi:thiol-disulfide isomerase/thioredoxin